MDKGPEIVKGKTDKRTYRYVELKNGLRCLLVHDDETQRSAAALDIHVGSYQSPAEYPGLAHFCEHMLFLGTDKYPVENEYSNFIQNHGGDKNAYTAFKNTNYFFSVANAAFAEALDRFSQFFKKPLFNADSTDREIKAVDSEHKKNFASDFRRLHQLLANHANPLSSMNRFCTGSAETLKKEGIRDRLLEYHKKYYSANLMTLILFGQQPLDTLEKLAHEQFEDIENTNVPLPDDTSPAAFDSSRLGKLFKVVPVSSKHTLRVMWLFPDTHRFYKSKPADDLAHLLGHEGPNSLLSYLIDEQLALSLTSSVDRNEANVDFLTAMIELTDKGLAQFERVAEIAAAFAQLLRAKGPQQYVFEEQARMSELSFNYRSQHEGIDAASSLARTLHDYPGESVSEVLRGPICHSEFKPELIQDLLDRLLPENMFIILSSPTCKSEATLSEKWYGTSYSVADFSPEFLTKLKQPSVGPSRNGKVLGLPPPNVLLPKNVDLLPQAPDLPKVPRVVKTTPVADVWYKQDHKYGVPKAYGFCSLWTTDNDYPTSDVATAFSKIYIKVFFEDIREFIYMAELAGIDCKLETFVNRLVLTFYGYHDSLPVLVDEFLKRLKAFDPTKCRDLFELKKAELIRSVESNLVNTPYMIALEDFPVNVSMFGAESKKRLAIYRDLTFETFLHYSKNWLKHGRLEWYIMGNLPETVAINAALNGESLLALQPLEKSACIRNRTVQIPPQTAYVETQKLLNPKEQNSCLLSYFQGDSYLDSELKLWCLHEVTCEWLKEPAFDYLRTKLQLGYIVDARSSNHNRVLGCRILVQSPVMAPELLCQKVDEYLEEMQKKVAELSEQSFKDVVESVAVDLRQPNLNMVDEALEYWKEIHTHERLFDRRERELAELAKLTKEDVAAYFKRVFVEHVRRFDFELVCDVHAEENEKAKEANRAAFLRKGIKRIEVVSPNEMRQLNPLYPDFFLLNEKAALTTPHPSP